MKHVSLNKQFLMVVSLILMISIFFLTAVESWFQYKTIQESVHSNLNQAARQLKRNFEYTIHSYLSTMRNISKQEMIVSYVVDDSDYNLYRVKSYLDNRTLIDQKAFFYILDYKGRQIFQTKNGDKYSNLSKVDNNLEKYKFFILEDSSNEKRILLTSGIYYNGSQEGLLVASISLRNILEPIFKDLGKKYVASLFVDESVVFRAGKEHSIKQIVKVESMPRYSMAISVDPEVVRVPVLKSFAISIGAGFVIYILALFFVIRVAAPKIIKPIENLGNAVINLSKGEKKTIDIETEIIEVNLLKDKFNRLLMKIDSFQEESIQKAHKAGMAEISTSVLHNIGNVVTGITLKNSEFSRIDDLRKVIGIIGKMSLIMKTKLAQKELENFLQSDPKGNQYLQTIEKMVINAEESLDNIERIGQFQQKQLVHVSEIIGSQQRFASGANITNKTNLKNMICDSLVLLEDRLLSSKIQITKTLENLSANLNRYGFPQVVVNLLVNSIESIDEMRKIDQDHFGEIGISLKKVSEAIILEIIDNGIGLEENKISEMFRFGFSTKDRQSGFGVHNCANYMKANNGEISFESQGAGKGARVRLIFNQAY